MDCGTIKSELLIAFASWEDRFEQGFRRDLERISSGEAVVFYFNTYGERTEPNRRKVRSLCGERGIAYTPIELDIEDPPRCWQMVVEAVMQRASEPILVDISTMPREIIWYVLWCIEQGCGQGRYIYHRPQEYGDDWLSRDARSPRLVYKLSGTALPSSNVALLVTVGYDLQRVRRLLTWCEPHRSRIGVQSESAFRRNSQVMEEYVELKEEFGCEMFELDAYAPDLGRRAIADALKSFGESHNVIMASLGPKPTSISLYRLQRARQDTGLVYAPANEFNESYSIGIGDCIEGPVW